LCIKFANYKEAWKLDAYLKKEESQVARSSSVGINPHVLKRTKDGDADLNPDVDCNGLSVTVLKKSVLNFSKCTLLFKTLIKLA